MQHRPRRLLYLALAVALLAALYHFWPREEDKLDPLVKHKEWRHAEWCRPGLERSFDLCAAEAGSIVRAGVLGDKPGAYVHLRLTVDGATVAEEKAKNDGPWRDFRFRVPRAGDCALTVTSPGPFNVGPVECFVPKYDKPNVLIFLIDTLRLDHVGCYGYPRPTTPAIDAFARDAIRLTQLTPQSSWTRPSVASLLTSTYPTTHGANDKLDKMREGMPKFAEVLARNGYETQGMTCNANCLPIWNMGKEFARYKQLPWHDDALLIDETIAALDNTHGRPCFFYVHAMGPHDPYEAPSQPRRFMNLDDKVDRHLETLAKDPRELKEAVALYDAEIAHTDAQFARLVTKLKTLRLYEDSLIVVLSDHGEEFLDHGGWNHGTTLYEELLRVPCLIKLPGNALAGEVRDGLAEMLDLAPTIADYLGLEVPPEMEGTSLRPMLERKESVKDMGYASLQFYKSNMHAARTSELKYIRDAEKGESWFDLAKDPRESTPLPTPPTGGEPLARYVHRVIQSEVYGLNLLILAGESEGGEIHGEIHDAALGKVRIVYPGRKVTLEEEEPGSARFSFVLEKAPEQERFEKEGEKRDKLHVPEWEFKQTCAVIRADLPPGAQPRINLTLDGKPIDLARVTAGPAGIHRVLDGSAVSLAELIAPPAAYDPLNLPKAFGVCLWYVPRAETVALDAIDPETREAMRALGYLD